jgi:hypothetical protein
VLVPCASMCNVNVTDWPGLRVAGTVSPEAEKSDPATDMAEMETGPFPVEVRVRDCVPVCPTVTLPKLMVVALTLNVGVVASSCNAKSIATPPELASRVAVCAEVTADMVAVNAAVVALAATVTVPGTDTAASLLDKFTLVPPLPAAELKVTVQVSEPEPVMDPLLQVIPLSVLEFVDWPVPLRLITAVGFDEELLVIDSWPESEPAAEGSNCTFTIAVLPGLIVTGNDSPEIEKPVPVAEAALIVTGAVPEEVRVSDLVATVLIESLPNAMLLALRLSVGV